MKFVRFFVPILVLVLVFSFSSPTSHPVVQAQDDIVVTIYFPIAVDSPVTEILDGYAEAYEDDHEGVDIVFSFEGGYADVKNKVLTVQEGEGELPALAIMLATDIYDLRNADVIQSLDDFADEEYLEDFAPTWLSNSYYDYDGDGESELYGIPFQRSTVLLYYNADLLEENGLTAPTNWEELATAAQTLTTDDRWGILVPNSFPYWVLQPFAAGSGQNIVSDSDVEVFFDDENVAEALQYWIDLGAEGAMPEGIQDNWGDAPGAFTDGTAAMIVHTSGSMTGILDRAEFNVGISAIPGQEGDFFTVTGGGNLYMMAGLDEEVADAAWDFVEWLTAPEQTVDWSIHTGYINTRVSGFESEAWLAYVEEHPQAADAATTLEVAVREFSVQDLGQIRTILHTHIGNILSGTESVEDGLAAAQEESDEILAIYQ